MNNQKLTSLIRQYASVKRAAALKQQEADHLRDRIATHMLQMDMSKYQGTTYYRVSETTVRRHTRQGYDAVRIATS